MERPKCVLCESEKCDKNNPNDAILIFMAPNGANYPSCHYCHWLKTRGVEWNPEVRNEKK